MTRKQLIEVVSRKTGQSEELCGEIIRAAFAAITHELNGHGHVSIPKFGVFYVEDAKDRVYVQPKTKKKTTIKARKYPKFRSAPALKDAVK